MHLFTPFMPMQAAQDGMLTGPRRLPRPPHPAFNYDAPRIAKLRQRKNKPTTRLSASDPIRMMKPIETLPDNSGRWRHVTADPEQGWPRDGWVPRDVFADFPMVSGSSGALPPPRLPSQWSQPAATQPSDSQRPSGTVSSANGKIRPASVLVEKPLVNIPAPCNCGVCSRNSSPMASTPNDSLELELPSGIEGWTEYEASNDDHDDRDDSISMMSPLSSPGDLENTGRAPHSSSDACGAA